MSRFAANGGAVSGMLLLLAGVYACSGDDDDTPGAASPDAAADAGSQGRDAGGTSSSGGPNGTACSPTEPFVNVTRVFEDDGSERLAPSLSTDETDLVFASNADSRRLGIFASRREAGAWGEATRIGPTDQEERDPSITGDGRGLVFTRGASFFRASRTDRTSSFGAATAMPIADYTPKAPRSAVVLDTALYFTDAEGGASRHVYRAGAANGDFVKPARVSVGGAELVSDKVAVSADEKVMYYAAPVSQVLQVFVTQRPSADEPWGTSAAVRGLLIDGDQRPGWAPPDQCRLYLTVTSPDNVSAVYVASRR